MLDRGGMFQIVCVGWTKTSSRLSQGPEEKRSWMRAWLIASDHILNRTNNMPALFPSSSLVDDDNGGCEDGLQPHDHL